MWDYPATHTKLGFSFLEKQGENKASFREQSAVQIRLLEGRVLNWKAKRSDMGKKHIMKDKVQNLAGQWQENPLFVNLIGVWHTHGGNS